MDKVTTIEEAIAWFESHEYGESVVCVKEQSVDSVAAAQEFFGVKAAEGEEPAGAEGEEPAGAEGEEPAGAE